MERSSEAYIYLSCFSLIKYVLVSRRFKAAPLSRQARSTQLNRAVRAGRKTQRLGAWAMYCHLAMWGANRVGWWVFDGPQGSKYLLRRYLDPLNPRNPPQTPSKKVLGALGGIYPLMGW